MEHIINTQLRDYLENSRLLHSAQHGFCRKRSCSSALLALLNRLFAAKNAKLVTAVVSLDYSRAFDTIDHYILIRKLASLNLSAGVLK